MSETDYKIVQHRAEEEESRNRGVDIGHMLTITETEVYIIAYYTLSSFYV